MRKSRHALLLGFWSVLGCGGEEPRPAATADSAVADVGPTDDVGAEAADTFVADTTMPDTAVPDATPPKNTADVQLLSISDWHGQLEPLTETTSVTSVTTHFGGIAALSSYFKADRATNPRTLTLTAGDAFGATPVLSTYGSTIPDEPTVRALNFLKLDADSFGNHNFDRGTAHLKSLIDVAAYKYVSTNLTNVTTELGTKVVVPSLIVDVGTGDKLVRVAVLGITNPDAPSLVFPGRFGTIAVKEPVAAANAAASDARAAGANLVIALTHMGATGVDPAGAPTGPLVDFAKALVGVDVVLGDHTDAIVNRRVGAALVVENRSKGRTYARVVVKVVAGAVTEATATIVDSVARYVHSPGSTIQVDSTVTCSSTTTACPSGYACSSAGACEKTCAMSTECTTGFSCASGKCSRPKTCPTEQPCPDTFTCTAGKCEKAAPITPDPDAAAVLKPYTDALSTKFDEKVARVSGVFVRDGAVERKQETPLGDLIAEAMLDRFRSSGAKIAFTNGGGIRAALPSSYAVKDPTLVRTGCSSTTPCDVVLGDIYTALPFGNKAVLRPITGKLLWEVLEHSVGKLPAVDGRFLQIAGFKFEAKVSNTVGSRIVKVTLDDGTNIPRESTAALQLVTNDFTNAGGDGYAMLRETSPSAEREILADIMLDYVKAKTLAPTSFSGRITLTP